VGIVLDVCKFCLPRCGEIEIESGQNSIGIHRSKTTVAFETTLAVGNGKGTLIIVKEVDTSHGDVGTRNGAALLDPEGDAGKLVLENKVGVDTAAGSMCTVDAGSLYIFAKVIVREFKCLILFLVKITAAGKGVNFLVGGCEHDILGSVKDEAVEYD
jgi:hypothetical protein